jgi:hypothetical protein
MSPGVLESDDITVSTSKHRELAACLTFFAPLFCVQRLSLYGPLSINLSLISFCLKFARLVSDPLKRSL